MKLSSVSLYAGIYILVLLFSSLVVADEATLLQRISNLEERVISLEKKLASHNTNWKDPAIWSRLRKEMTTGDVEQIFGKPNRVEEAIFTTWYYHLTAKGHSFVWFDEGKVLGWEGHE